jgi:hypothetical protein
MKRKNEFACLSFLLWSWNKGCRSELAPDSMTLWIRVRIRNESRDKKRKKGRIVTVPVPNTVPTGTVGTGIYKKNLKE